MQKLDYANILIYVKESTTSTYDGKSKGTQLVSQYL